MIKNSSLLQWNESSGDIQYIQPKALDKFLMRNVDKFKLSGNISC